MTNGDFEKIGKRMPYLEDESYINALVEKCTEDALLNKSRRRHAPVRRIITYASSGIAAAIAITALLFSVLAPGNDDNGFACTAETIANSKPLGTVLSQLSNDQLASLDYCTFDDLPTSETEDEY